jgi:nicotinamidase-related amidase
MAPEVLLPSGDECLILLRIELSFSTNETALLVVDVQVDFCSPYGRSGRSRHSVSDMLALPDKISSYIKEVTTLGVSVVFTKAVVDDKTMPENLKLFRKIRGINPPTQLGTGGEELCRMYMPEHSVVIEKPHFDAFGHTQLKEVLMSRNVQNVLVCGARTEICVDATAKRAAVEGFNTVILKDLELPATQIERMASGHWTSLATTMDLFFALRRYPFLPRNRRAPYP